MRRIDTNALYSRTIEAMEERDVSGLYFVRKVMDVTG